MKGVKKCTKFIVGLLSLFIIFAISSVNIEPVNAFGFGTAYPLGVYGINVYGVKGGTSVEFEQYQQATGGGYYYNLRPAPATGVEAGTMVHTIMFDTHTRKIPAGSIATFTVNFRSGSTTDAINIESEQFGQNLTLVNKHCDVFRSVEIGQTSIINQYYCTYWAYASSDIALPQLQGAFWFPYGNSSAISVGTNIGILMITDDSGGVASGLTEAQLNGEFRTWLNTKLDTLYSQGGEQLNALNQIKALLETQNSSTSEVKDAINELKEQQAAERAQEQQQLEDAQSDASDSGASSQSDASNTGTTLLSAFTSFVAALTSASPSNCRINMDMGNLNLGNVDLCSLSPPPVFQTIASIFLIAFCVPLSIATAKKVINLFRSFQS